MQLVLTTSKKVRLCAVFSNTSTSKKYQSEYHSEVSSRLQTGKHKELVLVSYSICNQRKEVRSCEVHSNTSTSKKYQSELSIRVSFWKPFRSIHWETIWESI